MYLSITVSSLSGVECWHVDDILETKPQEIFVSDKKGNTDTSKRTLKQATGGDQERRNINVHMNLHKDTEYHNQSPIIQFPCPIVY